MSFSRHLVGRYIELSKPDKANVPLLVTTFILEVQGNWLLVTAGHCIKEVEELRSKGWTLAKARLIDAVAETSRHLEAMPFDYGALMPLALLDDEKRLRPVDSFRY